MGAKQYLNGAYSMLSYGFSYLSHKVTGSPLPVGVSVELTDVCNLKCPECATGSGRLLRPAGYMDLSIAADIASSVRGSVLNANLYFQGEPMMHPSFFEIVSLFKGIKSVISTNGHFLTEENCRKLSSSGLASIIISLDGLTQSVYSSYRQGGKIDVVKAGIMRLLFETRKRSRAPIVKLLFLYGRHNSNELAAVRAFARELRVELIVKSMQIIDASDYDKWIPQDGSMTRYEKSGETYCLKKRPERGCLRAWTSSVITWDGNMIPCCYDKDATIVFGNLRHDTFMGIWSGDVRRSFISDLMKSRNINNICSKCPQGLSLFY